MPRTSSPLRPALNHAAVIGLGLLAACGGAETDAVAGSAATVYEGARLIDGNGGALEDAVFVVEGGRFTQVGARSEVEIPEGAARVDLTGRTVMPAFVNAHMHVPGATREEIIGSLEHNAYYGAGAVVTLGSDSASHTYQVRDETLPNAARLRTAGRGITRPEPGRTEVPYWVNTPEEARAAVQELATRRVDIVKVWVDDRNGQYEKLTPELYGAVIDQAHQAGLKVTAHIFSLEDAKGLLNAGLDAFAHGVRDQDVDEEFLGLVAANPNAVLVPNLPDPGVAADLSWLSGTVPAEQLAEMQAGATDRPAAQETFGIQARNLVRLNEAGMRIAFGTDGGNPWAAHQEMEDMVRAGMTPAQVLVAATRNTAEFMGLTDMGTVAAGKSADFIVLEGNPLDDITNTRRIRDVYLRGERVDRSAYP